MQVSAGAGRYELPRATPFGPEFATLDTIVRMAAETKCVGGGAHACPRLAARLLARQGYASAARESLGRVQAQRLGTDRRQPPSCTSSAL